MLGKQCSKKDGTEFSCRYKIFKTHLKKILQIKPHIQKQLLQFHQSYFASEQQTTFLLPIKPLFLREGASFSGAVMRGCRPHKLPEVDTSFLSCQLPVRLLDSPLGIISISFYKVRLLDAMNYLLHSII